MIKELNYTEAYGERLARKRDSTGFPCNIIFELTHRCNLLCRHCYVVPAFNKKELSTQEIKSVFDQLVEAGCLHITLTGGEPLMRKDILSLIDYARRIGLFVHLFTNATLITPQIADELKELQLVSLEISFHSLKKERFDDFTQLAGSYDKVMKAIELLKKRKINLAFKINITKVNLDEIEELKEFVQRLEATPEWATILMPRQDGSKDNLTLRLSPEEVFKMNATLWPGEGKGCDDKEMEERSWTRGRLFQCGGGKSGLAITPYGELKPCPEFPFPGYSIFGSALINGWAKVKSYVDSFKPSSEYKCFECMRRDFCGCCPVKAYLECGDMNGCPRYYRELAELAKRQAAKRKG